MNCRSADVSGSLLSNNSSRGNVLHCSRFTYAIGASRCPRGDKYYRGSVNSVHAICSLTLYSRGLQLKVPTIPRLGRIPVRRYQKTFARVLQHDPVCDRYPVTVLLILREKIFIPTNVGVQCVETRVHYHPNRQWRIIMNDAIGIDTNNAVENTGGVEVRKGRLQIQVNAGLGDGGICGVCRCECMACVCRCVPK
jgi:hypothetical protein